MRQRLTFLAPEGTPIDSKSIIVGQTSLNYTAYATATGIEQRTTLSLAELPKQLRDTLQDAHELHLRWTKAVNAKLPIPLISRLPAGLHLFFTPQDTNRPGSLCRTLKTFFGSDIKCDSVTETFSKPPILSERFASAATYQYYQQIPDLVYPVARLIRQLCPAATDKTHDKCRQRFAIYLTATQVDFEYDAISHAVVITAQWAQSSKQKGSSAARLLSTVDALALNSSVEVGVLAPEKGDEPEELKLGGYLTVVGEDEKSSPVLFGFPSRHHPLPDSDTTTYSSDYNQPTGLHPTLAITLPADTLQPPKDNCVLHTYLTLPSALFIDRYQLSDPALLSSKNLRALHALSGADDLEAPDWAIKQWGSAALLELVHPTEPLPDQIWRVEIPLHLRYLQSENGTADPSTRRLQAPWPIVFWACEAEDGLKMATNPFDRVNLGYDGLFGPKTMFYPIPPATEGKLLLDLTVPVLDPATASWVPIATLTVVLAGIAWVLWSLLGPLPKKAQPHAKED